MSDAYHFWLRQIAAANPAQLEEMRETFARRRLELSIPPGQLVSVMVEGRTECMLFRVGATWTWERLGEGVEVEILAAGSLPSYLLSAEAARRAHSDGAAGPRLEVASGWCGWELVPVEEDAPELLEA